MANVVVMLSTYGCDAFKEVQGSLAVWQIENKNCFTFYLHAVSFSTYMLWGQISTKDKILEDVEYTEMKCIVSFTVLEVVDCENAEG